MPSGIYNRELSKTNNGLFKKGIIPWNKGLKFPYKPIFKLRGKPSWNKGLKFQSNTGRTWFTKERVCGEKNCNWKGGVTPLMEKIRKSAETKLWRKSVFERDNFTCQKCGTVGTKLHPHHINNFADFPELRFVVKNGITFCKSCHILFHKNYSKRHNTKEQLKEFLNSN